MRVVNQVSRDSLPRAQTHGAVACVAVLPYRRGWSVPFASDVINLLLPLGFWRWNELTTLVCVPVEW